MTNNSLLAETRSDQDAEHCITPGLPDLPERKGLRQFFISKSEVRTSQSFPGEVRFDRLTYSIPTPTAFGTFPESRWDAYGEACGGGKAQKRNCARKDRSHNSFFGKRAKCPNSCTKFSEINGVNSSFYARITAQAMITKENNI